MANGCERAAVRRICTVVLPGPVWESGSMPTGLEYLGCIETWSHYAN